MSNYLGLIRRYWDFIPIQDENSICTLLEGNTSLISSTYLGPWLGLRLYLKYEGLNPTGSFKDRGMTVAVSKAIEEGARAIMCASTGNTSASAAAYAAKGGLNCYILVPEGKIARGKLA
ncbi:threonine synthase, partial [Candidatus Hakubella thermalkaliphila]